MTDHADLKGCIPLAAHAVFPRLGSTGGRRTEHDERDPFVRSGVIRDRSSSRVNAPVSQRVVWRHQITARRGPTTRSAPAISSVLSAGCASLQSPCALTGEMCRVAKIFTGDAVARGRIGALPAWRRRRSPQKRSLPNRQIGFENLVGSRPWTPWQHAASLKRSRLGDERCDGTFRQADIDCPEVATQTLARG